MTARAHDTVSVYAASWRPYWDAGWRGVLPLPVNAKGPVPTGWTGNNGADTSYADCHTFADAGTVEGWPVGNIALRLPDGVVGVDVDTYDGKPGADTLAGLVERFGPLPATWRSSARLSTHPESGIRVFRVPEGVRLVAVPGPGIEICQRHHRYMVVAPSVNPKTGTVYEWLDERTGEVGGVPSVADIPPLPAAWLAGLTDSRPPAVKVDTDVAAFLSALPPGPMCGCVDRLAASLTAAMGTVDGEARHDIAMRKVLAIVRSGREGCHGAVTALDRCGPVFVDAVAAARGGRDVAEAEWVRMVAGAAAIAAGEPEGALCPDDFTARMGARFLADPDGAAVGATGAVAGVTPVDPLGVRERFPVVDWRELWESPDTEEWIAEPLLPAGRLVALYSPPKVGKSLLMLEIAVLVSRGASVFGYPAPDTAHVVLYVDFENDPRGDIKERLVAMGYGPDDLGNLRYLSFPALAALDTERGGAELLAAATAYAADVVVIDTISRAVGGPENDNDTWLSFYRHTGLALKRAGVAAIRLDHTGKDETKGQRGGSAKSGDVDAVWRLSRIGGDTFRLECEDSRFVIHEKLIDLRRESAPLRHVVDVSAHKREWRRAVASAHADLDALAVPPELGYKKAHALLKAAGRAASLRAVRDAQEDRRQPLAGWGADPE